jgi:hypothetical protein
METHLSACHRVRGPRFAPLCLRPTGTVLCHVAIEGGDDFSPRAHEPTAQANKSASLHYPRLLPLHSWGRREGTHRIHKLRAQQASKKSFIKGVTWLQPSNRDDRRGVWCQRKLSRGPTHVARTRTSKQDLVMNHWGFTDLGSRAKKERAERISVCQRIQGSGMPKTYTHLSRRPGTAMGRLRETWPYRDDMERGRKTGSRR